MHIDNYDMVLYQNHFFFADSNVFSNMDQHILDQSVIDNHKVLLITAIIDCFLKIGMNYIGKSKTIDLQKKNRFERGTRQSHTFWANKYKHFYKIFVFLLINIKNYL